MTKSIKPLGKIAYADRQLLTGKMTKLEVAEDLAVAFSIPIRIAKNTTNWAASTMKHRIGKTSKHKKS